MRRSIGTAPPSASVSAGSVSRLLDGTTSAPWLPSGACWCTDGERRSTLRTAVRTNWRGGAIRQSLPHDASAGSDESSSRHALDIRTGANAMPYFLAKTDPGTYSIDDLERDGTTEWD